MRRTLRPVVLAVLFALPVLPLGGFFWLRSRGGALRSGTATVQGLEAAVRVRFDRWGVPHLDADRLGDAMAALGWLHANDRMTQMELGRRAAAGRLSELFGGRTVAIDREMRELRLRWAAEKMLAGLSADSQTLLAAYATGVNAWLESRRGNLPPALTLLRANPETWEPVDSLGFVLLMARDLSFWQGRPEEERFAWLGRFGAQRVAELVGGGPLEVLPGVALPLLGRWWNRGPFPQPGSASTPAAFGGGWRGDLQPVSYGPSMRWIAVPGDGDRALAVLPGGQSAHPADAHYDDQLALYRAGGLHTAPWSEAAVAAATVSELLLVPAPSEP